MPVQRPTDTVGRGVGDGASVSADEGEINATGEVDEAPGDRVASTLQLATVPAISPSTSVRQMSLEDNEQAGKPSTPFCNLVCHLAVAGALPVVSRHPAPAAGHSRFDSMPDTTAVGRAASTTASDWAPFGGPSTLIARR